MPAHRNIQRFGAEKDDTDTALAIEQESSPGIESVFHLYGCTGGRLEHTIANIQCLISLSRRICEAIMISGAGHYCNYRR